MYEITKADTPYTILVQPKSPWLRIPYVAVTVYRHTLDEALAYVMSLGYRIG